MENVSILPANAIGRSFIPKEFLPAGEDEYYLRNRQIPWPQEQWRHLRADEIERLVQNDNASDNWNDVLVADPFDPQQVKNTRFFGLVRIGRLPNAILAHHDLQTPVGITNSVIIACDIGHETAIHNVRYLAHYIVGDRCILLNIDEMHATNHAKFGNGILKDGEEERVRVWIELMNESGSRGILPFDGIISADAYLWAKYRDDVPLQKRLLAITQASTDNRRGYYGVVGEQCVIKNSRSIKDVKIGACCYINGTNKLKNLTVNSSETEPTQIGDGVELVNGIIGNGCHISYGCKAVRFILGNNSNLKYGARLIHSFLGDNSTISCCEVLNNLIFPAHEQHHNNSFLIASLVMGQSNVAAGATIGSNHNSRANDNEVQAGRGFWPGLCSSIKHSSRFASFTLLSKADYPAELDTQLPFALLNNNPTKDQLEIMPAFWWLYNMYALTRNTWKFQTRDKRKKIIQNIEYDFLAPDTVEEIIHARHLLEVWTAKAYLRQQPQPLEGKDEGELSELGRKILSGQEKQVAALEVLGEHMERSGRKAVVLKTSAAYRAYADMLQYYAVKNLMDYREQNPQDSFESMCGKLQNERQTSWVNFGGQLIPEPDVDTLRADTVLGKCNSWNDIHTRYNSLWSNYPTEKQKHAYAVWCLLLGTSKPNIDDWRTALERAEQTQEFIRDQVYISRKKDFDNPFLKNTYRNKEEMVAAIGTIEDNDFVQQLRKETDIFKQRVEKLKRGK